KLDVREGEKKGFYIVENFKPRFVPVETRDLYSISIEDDKRERLEKKLVETLEFVKENGIAIIKLLCRENVDQKRLSELTTKRAKYTEINFRRKDLKEIPEAKPEKEFFTDLELKILEILKEDDEIGLKSAIELLKEYYGLKDQAKVIKEDKEVREAIPTEKSGAVSERKIEEKGEKRFKTLLDFI
ncbi:MAG: hypothetical protein QXF06_04335, partial [Archaeoglobaceae archaeon]